MTTQSNVSIDNILKGVNINNDEINYIAIIEINFENDVVFEYAVIDEDLNTSPSNIFIPFTDAKKNVKFEYRNTNNIYTKKLLVLKTKDGSKSKADINIKLTPLNYSELHTSMAGGEIGRFHMRPTSTLLAAESDTPGTNNAGTNNGGTNTADTNNGGTDNGGTNTADTNKSNTLVKEEEWYKKPINIAIIILIILIIAMLFYKNSNSSGLSEDRTSLFLE